MARCRHRRRRHDHLCGVCAAKGAAKLPVAATVGVLAIGAAPYVGAWKLGRALFRRGSWSLTPEAQAVRDARRARRSGRHARRPEPQAKWSDRR